jgi:hypothetical protein
MLFYVDPKIRVYLEVYKDCGLKEGFEFLGRRRWNPLGFEVVTAGLALPALFTAASSEDFVTALYGMGGTTFGTVHFLFNSSLLMGLKSAQG